MVSIGMALNEPAKRCSTCREIKPLDAFNSRTAAKDGRQWACRECNSRYHRDNWDRHMSQIRSRRKAVRAENLQHLWEYLSEHPCVDCGLADPAVLEFDHLGDKRGDIARMKYDYPWSSVLAEIAKCEVVCANCHRRRTDRRSGSWRARQERVGRLGFEPRPTTG